MEVLLFQDDFDYPDGVITNEYATQHPNEAGIHRSLDWVVTSGTLFARNGTGYSGVPDSGWDAAGRPAVDIDSTLRNGSAVLRAITRRTDYVNVSVRFSITNYRLVESGRNDGKLWNGLHVFIRRQNENNTYYVDVNRRDNMVYVKRKLRGVYTTIGQGVPCVVMYGSKQEIRVDAWSTGMASVQLTLSVNRRPIQFVVDHGSDTIPVGGAVGLRADNCEFAVDDFEVWSREIT